MKDDCKNLVTHIDNKGFIYCEHHGKIRKTYRPTRKLKPSELKKISNGKTIKKY